MTPDELMEEACRLAVESVHNNWGAEGPSIAKSSQNTSTLELIPRPDGSPDPLPERAWILKGLDMYVSGAPCPMCMSAIYWSRLDSVRFASDLAATSNIGFGDAFQYEDFLKPLEERLIDIAQFRPDLGARAYAAWMAKKDRHP